jgi:TRAP-type C4-dicarboxylate transport system permease small subunit
MNFYWTLKVGKVLSIVAAFWMFLLAFLIAGDVVGRTFFNHPLIGTPELAANSIAMIAFLQIPFAVARGAQLRVTAISAKLSKKNQIWHEIVVNCFGIIFFLIISIAQVKYAVIAWKILEYEGEGALRVPTYPVRTIIVICAFLAAIEFCKNCFKKKKLNEGVE